MTVFRHTRPTIRITIMTAFVGLLLFAAIPIMGYMHYQNTKALLELADQLMTQVSETVIAQTESYLRPAAAMVKISSRITEPERFTLTADSELEDYAITVLQSYPQLAMFNMGDEHGNFLMPKKMPDGTIATKAINRDATPPTVTWKYRDKQGRVIRSETSTDVVYDPRVRPWYRGAASSKRLFWTDMYILFTDQIPGITTSYPVLADNGEVIGVLGLDIELGALSVFLKDLKLGENGTALIFNERNEVVAYPDVGRIARKEAGELRPVHVDELGEEHLVRCLDAYKDSDKVPFRFTSGGVDYVGSVRDFPTSLGMDWQIAMVVPEEDFIGALRETARTTLLIALAILLASLLLARQLARSIARPVTTLASEARQIKEFQFGSPINLTSSIMEIQDLADALAGMKTGLSAFRKYVPAALVQQLVHTGEAARLGGHREQLTIFFSDIAGFTHICENLSPEQLMVHLSEYLDEMTRVVRNCEGTVDKYIGDAIMAFWGAPLPQDNHAHLACRAALGCQRRLEKLNQRWEREGKVALPTRIGIHTGEVVVGNIGSSERMNYSALGDAVNVANRLEGANKAYGTRIIVSHETYEQVCGGFLIRPLDKIAVLGRARGFMVYELMGEKNDSKADIIEDICCRFADALDAYFKWEWAEAMRLFDSIAHDYPDDSPSRVFGERCRRLAADPPSDNWDGTTHLETK